MPNLDTKVNLPKTVGIVGLGLIGGSIARGLKLAVPEINLFAFDQNAQALRQAVTNGWVDQGFDSLEALCDQSECVVLATPVFAIEQLVSQIAGLSKQPSVVTDVGSVKTLLETQLKQAYNGQVPAHWVLGHPIAGSEQSGVSAADPMLFSGKKAVLITPSSEQRAAFAQVTAIWETLGAVVCDMSVQAHDELFAATSHLPHLLAYAFVNALTQYSVEAGNVFDWTAGGFRDFSRIASSDPAMWHDIVMSNPNNIRRGLAQFRQVLDQWDEALAQGRGEVLLEGFTKAKRARDQALLNSNH